MMPRRRQGGWLGAGLILAALAVAIVAGARLAPVATVVNTVTVGLDAGAVAVDTRTGRVLVANRSDGTISFLDARTGALLRTVTVGKVPFALAVDAATGRAFVLDDAGNAVDVLNTVTGAVVRVVSCGEVHDVAIDQRVGHVFVVGLLADGASGVYMLDARDGKVLRTTLTGMDSWAVAVDEQSGRAFVTNRSDNSVSVLNTTSGALIGTVAVGMRPAGLAVDARINRVFVADMGDNTTPRGVGSGLTILDARTGRVLNTVPLSRDPDTVAVDERTNRVFVLHGLGGGDGNAMDTGKGGVDMLDARTGRVVRGIAVGANPDDEMGAALFPHMMAVDEDHQRVYVINPSAFSAVGVPTTGTVSVLDGANGRVLRVIGVGKEPVALAVDRAAGRLFVVNKDGRMTGIVSQHNWAWAPPWLARWLPQPPPPNMDGTVTVIDDAHL